MFKCRRISNKEQCIICLDSKKVHLECNKCYSCKICKDCIIPLSNCDLYDNCPLCREPEWQASSRLSSQVIPSNIKLNLDVRIKEIYKKPAFKSMCCSKEAYLKFVTHLKIAYFTSLIMIISYMFGLLCIFIIMAAKHISDINPYVLIFLPLPVGFLLINSILCCCCEGKCLRDFKSEICSKN